jgi:hypothetical protein
VGEAINDNHERYFEKTLKSCATFLSRWNGAQAEMSVLRWPPKALRILLTADGVSGNLVITCHDPLLVSGPPRWSHADIAVIRHRLPKTLLEANSHQDGFRVIDQAAGLDLITPAITVSENVKLKESPVSPLPPAGRPVDRPPPRDSAEIPEPAFRNGQHVRVVLSLWNRTARQGMIRDRIWHHKDQRWYFLIDDDAGRKVSKRYAAEDLEIDEPDDTRFP